MRRFTGNTPGLVVLCAVQFVVVLDVTVVATALPAIRSSLGFNDAGLAWVVTAYTVVLGALLVPGGRVADLLGPRRALVTGLGIFVAASVTCAIAWTPAALIAARAAQGLGAALLAPAALALLAVIGRDATAVGWWTAAGAIGGGSGWVLGGLLADHLGWPAVFWINVPIGLAAMILARRLPAVPRRRDRRVDVRGAILIASALGLLVHLSWGSFAAAAALIALFVWHIHRDADPLLPPGLLRRPAVAGANLTAALLTASTTPAMYLAMLHLQQVRGFSAARAALLFPIFNVAVVAGSLLAPRAYRRFGARRVATTGFTVIASGTALVCLGLGLAEFALVFGLAFALIGAGLGAASVASTRAGTTASSAASSAVASSDAASPSGAASSSAGGVAAGVLTASAQIGTALGLAALTPLGYRAGLIGATAVALAGVAAAFLLPRLSVPAGNVQPWPGSKISPCPRGPSPARQPPPSTPPTAGTPTPSSRPR
jgi:MFS family permease